MRNKVWLLAVLLFVVLSCAPGAYAQGGVRSGPDPSTLQDPDLEKDSLHNLEVARQYFKLRKAYVGALERCEEVLAGNPTFSKIDEVLYIAGSSTSSDFPVTTSTPRDRANGFAASFDPALAPRYATWLPNLSVVTGIAADTGGHAVIAGMSPPVFDGRSALSCSCQCPESVWNSCASCVSETWGACSIAVPISLLRFCSCAVAWW